jgi:hypothetical protein
MAYKRRSSTGADGTRHTTTINSKGGTTRSSSSSTGSGRYTTSQNSKTGKTTTTRSGKNVWGTYTRSVSKGIKSSSGKRTSTPKVKKTKETQYHHVNYTNDDLHDLAVGALQLGALTAAALIAMVVGFWIIGTVNDIINNIF